jgi:uncharacterized delta-60 repeat protein
MATAPDGKVVVAGIGSSGGTLVGAVGRYLLDGTLDPSFGSGGSVLSSTFAPRAVAVQPDGKVVAAGGGRSGADTTFQFVRYLVNGSPDPSFGGGTGVVNVLVDTPDNKQRAEAVAVAPDGKIVAAGLTQDGAGFVRLNTNGTPDTTFGGDGSVDVAVADAVNGATDVAVGPDGSVVAAVPTGAGLGNGFTVIRLDKLGNPDTSFGPGGVLHIPAAGSDGAVAEAVAVQPDGKIVVGGAAELNSGPDQFDIARFNSNGTPDSSFFGGNQELTPIAPNGLNADGAALVLQPNGRIVLVGQAHLDANRQTIALARYNGSDGGLDSSFGSGGIVLAPFPAGWQTERVNGAGLACDGRIVVGGDAETAPAAHEVFLTARFLGDPIPCAALNPPVPLPGAPDHAKPHSHIRRIPHVIRASKLGQFAGTASDNSGVAKVEIALLRRVGRTAAFSRVKTKASCLWLRSNRAKFKKLRPKRGKCATARFLRAKGTTKWVFKLRRHLAPGSYILYARATDTTGNRETRFSSKLGNRAAFRVIAG